MQYGIRLSQTDMEWGEFSRLLSGIMPETPLGSVVQIRSENDKDRLKAFTPDQLRIRNEWRNHHSRLARMTVEEKAAAVKQVQSIFAGLAGK